MKIKKDVYTVKFLVVLGILVFVFLNTFCFVLGFDKTPFYATICFIINSAIVLLGIAVYVLYNLLCKSYYLFDEISIKLIIKDKIVQEINYNQILYCIYHGWIDSAIWYSNGSFVTIFYNDDEIKKNIDISISRFKLKKLICLYMNDVVIRFYNL